MSVYDKGVRKDELIARLRRELSLSKAIVTDEDLLEGTKDTFLFARIELGMAWAQLWKDVKAKFEL